MVTTASEGRRELLLLHRRENQLTFMTYAKRWMAERQQPGMAVKRCHFTDRGKFSSVLAVPS